MLLCDEIYQNNFYSLINNSYTKKNSIVTRLILGHNFQHKIPLKSIFSNPYEIWKGKRSSLKHLKIWVCPAYVKNIEGHKVSARLEKYKFVGYLKESIGYYFYHPTQQKVLLEGMSFF